ncbi:unnamed protein product [Dracunculus medinensis]|uniref:Uncharacterized protein n=1 Tax=Dracunculus medinensis TaxID=318479 RepID=A0A0N4UCV9_DRAME|nr:unnamed protein product [Dracunculus medinensis]
MVFDISLFIIKRLQLADVNFDKKFCKSVFNKFICDYIKMDGAFVLKMISIHAGVVISMEIADALWENFIDEQEDMDESRKLTINDDSKHFESDILRHKISALVPLMSREKNRPFHRSANNW